MSLFTKVIQAVQSWRRRRGATKTRTEARIGLEQLDHRQLLAVNFTGVVATDFPATQVPGVVTILDNGSIGNQTPLIPNNLQQAVKVSGFNISGIASSYDPTTDTLSVGLIQPLNQKPDLNGNQYPVIAGDADNNGNSGTVSPVVTTISPNFQDPANLSGSERMGITLNLTGGQPNPNIPSQTIFPADVVAGFAGNLSDPKHYEVALPVPASDPLNPSFGTELTANEGAFSLINDPKTGALELGITHFSALYQQITGQALTPTSVIRLGAFAGSGQDGGISEEFFPPQSFTVAQASPPPIVPPMMCPPASPPVLINPHSARHVNTAHAESVRVTIQGTSGFDPTQIDPTTVRLGSAAPFTEFTRNFNHSDFPSETFVFRGYDVSLPGGITPATVTGQLRNGQKFESTQLIFNRNDSFYTPGQIAARDAKLGFTPPEELLLEMAKLNANGDQATINANILAQNSAAAIAAQTIPSTDATYHPPLTVSIPAASAATAVPMVDYNAATPAATRTAPVTVAIPKRTPASAAAAKAATPHPRLAAALQKANKAAAAAASTGTTAAQNVTIANLAS